MSAVQRGKGSVFTGIILWGVSSVEYREKQADKDT